jgi:hypothetical protein
MRPSLTLPDKPAYDPAQHYLRADAAFNAYNLKTDEACENHAIELAKRLYRECKRKPSLRFLEAFAHMVFGLFHDDELYFFSKPSRFGKKELEEFERNLSPERIDQAVQFALNLGWHSKQRCARRCLYRSAGGERRAYRPLHRTYPRA